MIKVTDTKIAEPLFKNGKDTAILSCLQNIMGSVFVDNIEEPKSAMAILGDFCFFAGEPSEELVATRPEDHDSNFIIMVPENEAWADVIARVYEGKSKRITRYAIKKEGDIFDREKLQEVVASLDKEFTIQLIDEDLYMQCKTNGWGGDLVSQFPNYEMYKKLGLGVGVCKDGVLVAGASSYSRYQDGIEIEIDTKEDFRRRGLAYACGAKLVLECLERGLYPSWDAQNKWSVGLAEKLGYHFDHEYPAVEVYEY